MGAGSGTKKRPDQAEATLDAAPECGGRPGGAGGRARAHLARCSSPSAPAPPAAHHGGARRGSRPGARTGWGRCVRRCRTPPRPPRDRRTCRAAGDRAERRTVAQRRTAGPGPHRRSPPRPRRKPGSSCSGPAPATPLPSRWAAAGSAWARRSLGRATTIGTALPLHPWQTAPATVAESGRAPLAPAAAESSCRLHLHLSSSFIWDPDSSKDTCFLGLGRALSASAPRLSGVEFVDFTPPYHTLPHTLLRVHPQAT